MGGRLPYELILALRDGYDVHAAVETGTELGASARWLAAHFRHVWTIEKDPYKYSMVAKAYKLIPNLMLLQGDSGELLPGVLAEMDEPAVFWLDAHKSDTRLEDGRILHDCPRLAELRAIAADDARAHYVILDDARLFTGHKGPKYCYDPDLWPSVKDLQGVMPSMYEYWMHSDMILFMPHAASDLVAKWTRGRL